MSPILPGHHSGPSGPGPTGRAWYVRDRRYDHTAARFWMTLLDEISERVPESDRMELAAASALPFDPELLDPVASLEHMFEKWLQTGYAEELNTLITELDWAGPPSDIHLTLFREDAICLEGNLSPEFADAETFMYLTAWLLEWADIPDFLWARESLKGAFDAQDPDRRRAYHVNFRLHTRPLSEGLVRYTLSLKFRAEQDVV